jgi:hypothetical protein
VDALQTIPTMDVGEACCHGTAMDSVTWEVGLPQVCGLKGDEGSFVCIMRATVGWDMFDNPSLMDGGANICIMDMLVPKWKQTLFGNGDSPYGNIRVSLPISVR